MLTAFNSQKGRFCDDPLKSSRLKLAKKEQRLSRPEKQSNIEEKHFSPMALWDLDHRENV